MKDIEITAFGSFEPGEYGEVEVDGVGKCSGPFSAQSLEVNGVLNTHGAVRCDKAEVNGTFSCVTRLDAGEMEINGAVKVDGDAGIETLEVNGALNVHGKLECTSLACDGAIRAEGDLAAGTLEVDGALTAKGGISADTIDVDGALTAGGQVSADHIHVEGVISAGEVVGDEVVIWNKSWSRNFHCVIKVGSQTIELGNGGNQEGGRGSASRIGLIEATTIALQGVEATTVNGTDVTIGPGCVIENLDCNGTLSIDPAAQVAHITGEYTLAED